MGTKNARKCSNGARAYTPRLSPTGRRDTKANHALRQDRFRQVALTGLASESVHKFDAETVSFSIIFQFQVLPKRTPLQAGATALLPSRFSPRVVSNLSDRSCSGPPSLNLQTEHAKYVFAGKDKLIRVLRDRMGAGLVRLIARLDDGSYDVR